MGSMAKPRTKKADPKAPPKKKVSAPKVAKKTPVAKKSPVNAKELAKAALAPAKGKPAKKSANMDAEAKALIEIATECMPSDQVRAMVAGLDVVELANAGSLSSAVTLEAWRAGVGLADPSSQKATKAQAKVLAERGVTSRNRFKAACARLYLAARKKIEDDETSSVAWLLVGALLDEGAYTDAIDEFKRWTPVILKLGRAGKFEGDTEWLDRWYRSYLWKLEGTEHEAERERATAERDKAKARA